MIVVDCVYISLFVIDRLRSCVVVVAWRWLLSVFVVVDCCLLLVDVVVDWLWLLSVLFGVCCRSLVFP